MEVRLSSSALIIDSLHWHSWETQHRDNWRDSLKRIELEPCLRRNQTLNDDGMFLPGPSRSGQSSRDNNEETLLATGSDFQSGQGSPDRKRRHREGRHMQDIIPNKKPRYHLKEHTEKKTCPKDLRYNIRINIVPDDEFKSDISHIRRKAEQKLMGALTATTTDEQKATKSSSNIWRKDQIQPEERKRTILI